MTCSQGPCDVPTHLATHDCFSRPLSGWEVRSVLSCVLPMLIVVIPRHRKKGLIVLPKGDLSPFIVLRAAGHLADLLPITVLVEDEALALRLLDESEAEPALNRKFSIEFVYESLEQHAKHTTQEYDVCLIFDYVKKPRTVSVVPYVTKVCRTDASVAHVSRPYTDDDAGDEGLIRFWEETISGVIKSILATQLKQVTESLVQTYIDLLRRPTLHGSAIAGNNVNSVVGIVVKLTRDTSRKIRPYNNYYDLDARTMTFDSERTAAARVLDVKNTRPGSLGFMFLPQDHEDWLKRHTEAVGVTPGTQKLNSFITTKEASHESVGVQQFLGRTLQSGPQTETRGPGSDGGPDLRARPPECK